MKTTADIIYESAYQQGQINILKEVKRELIDSDFVTFSQVVDFLTNKIEEVQTNDQKRD